MPRCRCRCRRRRRQTLKTSVIISAPLFVRSIASHSNGQDRTSPTLDTCTRIHPPTRLLYSARLAHLCSKLRRLRRCSSLKGERRKAAATADMAERAEESTPKAERESIREKILEKIHDHSSSSSDSDDDKVKPSSSVKSRISHLFGREKPVHQVFGGGKPADVFLWRNKKTSAGVLGVATAIWILFEVLEYHLLTLVSHVLIFTLAILFLWSNATTFINKSPPHIPEVSIPEDQAVNIALSLRHDINKSFAVLRDIVTGRDLKKFLAVIAGLWILSIIGGSVSFLTLFYAVFVLLHTIPVLYEKYEDKVDFYWDKTVIELKKHYNAVYAKVANKIPSAAQLKAKKHQ